MAKGNTKSKKIKKIKKDLRKQNRRKKSIIYKILLVLEILVIVSFLIAGILIKYISGVTTTKLNMDEVVVTENDPNMDDYTNIALFGIDTRNTDMHAEASRSDAIIIVTIHNATKKVQLTSVFRDSYSSVNGTYTKINHAYAYGGPELAISTLNRNFDLNITKYATVNFKIMADIVDSMGGIPLTVEADFIDDLNHYIKSVNHYNGGDSPLFTKPGEYIFDGNQTVAYARIRHNQNGDISRASRQRIVLEAIMDTAKSHPMAFLKTVETVIPRVQTNLTTGELMKMALSAPRYSIVKQQGFPYYHEETRLSDGLYYDIPTTLEKNVVELHKNLFGTENYQISEELSKINQKIQWQTGYY